MILLIRKIFLGRSVFLILFLFFLVQFVCFITPAFGQATSAEDTIRQCFTGYMTRLMQEKFPKQPVSAIASDSEMNSTYFIIPVVVHVIHLGGVENISDDLIKSQIDVLNEDYGHYGPANTDKRGADTKIRFCLAKKDPWGNPTTGINRIYSQYSNLVGDSELFTKELSTWNPKKYMNFWIVKSINGSATIQAYSYLPSTSGGPAYAGDGVVVTYKYFGKGGNFSTYYNLGKTSTHESGHYFDLLHTWGRDGAGYGDCNDDDGIEDTPDCSLEYYSSPVTKCFHPVQCGYVRMIENYLDYSTDGCMTLFTSGQANKMISAIQQFRRELVSRQNLSDCGCSNLYDSLNNFIDIQLYPTIVYNDKIFLHIKNNYKLPLTFNIFDMYGRVVYTQKISGGYRNVGNETKEIDLINENGHLRPGVYILQGTYAGSFQRKFIIATPF
jgi:hypothetical protein